MRRPLACLLLVAACSASGTGGRAPGDDLGSQGFWSLVAQAAKAGGPAVEDRADALTQLLKTSDQASLESFQQHLVQASDRLYTYDLEGAAELVCGPLDPDGQTAFRSWAVAQGEATYDRVVADPDALAGITDVKDACEGAGVAFGDAAVARYSDLGYEPGSPSFPAIDPEGAPAGPVHTAAQLKALVPTLAKRFS